MHAYCMGFMQVQLLFLSDSKRLRSLVPGLLATTNITVLANGKVHVHHVMTQHSAGAGQAAPAGAAAGAAPHDQPAPTDYKMVLQSSAAEHWLLSLADMHVVSVNSGFGRTAAALGHHEHAYIYMRGAHTYHDAFKASYRTCVPSRSLTMHDLAQRAPGI